MVEENDRESLKGSAKNGGTIRALLNVPSDSVVFETLQESYNSTDFNEVLQGVR